MNPFLPKKPRTKKHRQPEQPVAFIFDRQRVGNRPGDACLRVKLHGLSYRAGAKATAAAVLQLHGQVREQVEALGLFVASEDFTLAIGRSSGLLSLKEEEEAVDLLRAAIARNGWVTA